MKPFTKRLALVMGLLFTALICCGIVFIDTTQNYWYVNSGFVKLIVSNQTAQATFTVSTNTGAVGINTNEANLTFNVAGRRQPTNATGNGASAVLAGAIRMDSGAGGETAQPTTASGGDGGPMTLRSGAGANANSAVTNATGGNAGGIVITSGAGGAGATGAGVATNAATGGNGGALSETSGAGGSPGAAATNTVGGNGGAYSLTAGVGGTPSAGWARKGGVGGSFSMAAGTGGGSVRTNSGAGGAIAFAAGGSGNVTATSGNAGLPGELSLIGGNSGSATGTGTPSPGGPINLSAGNGNIGTTNSDGGHVFISGGIPGSGAVPGNVVLARIKNGTSYGAGVQIGPLITGGSATITNVLGAAASLDFPSTAAGTFSELTIAVMGVTSNNVAVALSVPWESAQQGGAFVTFNSNDVIYVRFINNQPVTAIDPTPGTFTVVGFRIR